MIITKKFLMDARTEAGAWTRAQIEIVGITWPPRSGWHNTLIGKSISSEIAKAFIEARLKRKSKFPLFCRSKQKDSFDDFDDQDRFVKSIMSEQIPERSCCQIKL